MESLILIFGLVEFSFDLDVSFRILKKAEKVFAYGSRSGLDNGFTLRNGKPSLKAGSKI